MSSNDQFNPDPADFVIVVMGLTGTGKTNFINKLTGNPERREAGSLVSDTQHVTPYPIPYHPSLRVVLVDTPGFDDTHRKDSETLELITDWLTQKYPDGTLELLGIIYFHRITNNSMSGSTLRNLEILRQLCGDTSLPRTRLVTTMWDQAKNQYMAAQRETQLISKFWRDLIAGGASARRFHNSSSSAWDIVEDLLRTGNDCHQLLLQEEPAEQRKRLNETEVAKLIYKQLQKDLAEQRKTLKGLEGEVKLQNDPNSVRVLRERCDKTQAQAKKTSEELKEMRISPISRVSLAVWRKIPCKSC